MSIGAEVTGQANWLGVQHEYEEQSIMCAMPQRELRSSSPPAPTNSKRTPTNTTTARPACAHTHQPTHHSVPSVRTCHAVRFVHDHQRQRHARAQRIQQVRVVEALGADKQNLDAPSGHVAQDLCSVGAGAGGHRGLVILW